MTNGPLEFIRLIDGRLWHVYDFATRTMCGTQVRRATGLVPELVEEEVPMGAWVCARCVTEITRRADAARKALQADPRRREAEAAFLRALSEDEAVAP